VALGGLARVLDGGNAGGTRVGVLLDGVEADLVTVGIVQVGQDPPDAGEVHPVVVFAQRGQPDGQLVKGRLAGYADREIVKAGRGPGPDRSQPQRQLRAAVWVLQDVAHQPALLDELHRDLVAQPSAVPLARARQVAHRQLEVVDASQRRGVSSVVANRWLAHGASCR
jgi:hypothetical protein